MFAPFWEFFKSRLSWASSKTWCNIYTCTAFFLSPQNPIFQNADDKHGYMGIMGDRFKSHSCKKSPENAIF